MTKQNKALNRIAQKACSRLALRYMKTDETNTLKTCPHCGVGQIGTDNCSACTWAYSIAGWQNSRRGIRRLTVDTCCVNAKNQNVALNQLEKWKSETKVEIQRTDALLQELKGPPKRLKKAHSIPDVPDLFVLGSSVLGGNNVLSGPDLRGPLRAILFPTTKTLTKNQEYDLAHLHQHIQTGGDVFITINSRDFMYRGKQEKLRQLGVWVLTPEDTVSLIKDLYDWA